jgi:phosphomannomutase
MAFNQPDTAVHRQVHPDAEYCCPGQRAPISRAVHLGRLTRYYPGCRSCPQRHDTGTLSSGRVKRLDQPRPRVTPAMLFSDEAVQGTYLNDLDPATAGAMGRALGVYLTRQLAPPGGPSGGPPLIVIAGDGRSLAPEMVAAAGDGLRWSGAKVIDIGSSTAPCLAFSIRHLRALGGILVGNHPGRVQTAGLKFWTTEPCSKAADGPLEAIARIFQEMPARPQRTSGLLTRYRADVTYLGQMSHLYHALRPLRFVLDTNSPPPADYVRRLIGPTACEFVPRRTRPDRLGEQVGAEEVHFGLRIDQDGERCLAFDERGRQVENERMLLLLVRYLLKDPAGRAIVLEDETSPETARRFDSLGLKIVRGDSRRAEMHRLLRQSQAALGGGPSGRFWYRLAQTPAGDGPDHYTSAMIPNVAVRPEPCEPHYAPDALLTLSHLLGLLSQSDRPLSSILDADIQVA